jgi:uncharacterized membrane protein YagU involved in acid resistance
MQGTPLLGANAGFLATFPMTTAMEAMFRDLPFTQKYPLPPRQITQELARKLGFEGELTERQHEALALASHFAYGAAMGGIYGLVTGGAVPRGALSGMLFGLGVWSASYLGLLPALDVLPPATEHPARRNALMILAHLVWGSSVGALTQQMEGSTRS